jgi:hypothetical protein
MPRSSAAEDHVSRRRLPVLAVLAVLLVLLVLPHPAAAQLLRISPGGGEVGVEMRGLQSALPGREDVWDSYASSWLNIPFSGALLSPRFLTYNAAVRPSRSRQSAPSGSADFELRALGLSAGATLLPAFPLSLSVHGERSTADATREGFGASTGARNASSGAMLRYRLPAFPMRVERHSLQIADAWRPAPDVTPIRRDESLDVVRFTGESSKLNTVLERQRFTDRVGALDFASSLATLVHVLRWGHGSSLATHLEDFRRAGRDAQVRRGISEHLRLRHAEHVRSELTLHRQRSRQGTDYRSAITSTSLAVNAEPRPWLSGRVSLVSTDNTFAVGRMQTIVFGPSITVRRELPAGVRLHSNAALTYQRTDRDRDSELPTPVSDETYVIEATRSFTLRRERIDRASIEVFNRDRTQLYLEGLDYRLLPVGDQLRIEVPLASRIAVGDLVLVDYTFLAPTARNYDLRSASASVLLTRGSVSLKHDFTIREARLLDGPPNGDLEGGDDRMTMLEGRRSLRGVLATAGLQHRTRGGSRADFSATELRVGLAAAGTETLQGSLGGSLGRTRSVSQVAGLVTAHGSLQWTPLTALTLVTTLERQDWRLSDSPDDRTTLLGTDLSWRRGRMDTEFRYQWLQRSTAGGRVQHRLQLRMKRRF